ncbi:16S rRNA (guanine(527)-N(7))-methyltransferase RsmG, partial [bacterium]
MLDRFETFEADLYEANEVMNLTRVPREECWLRHFLDSLLIAPWLPGEGSLLDIGSGPGFPAWPLALARPELQVTALDSSGKMLG